MRLIVCVDEGEGLSFGGRRQSRDRAVCQRILELTEEDPLWMDTYSAKLFADAEDRICVSDSCLEQAGENDWCFAEIQDLTSYTSKVNTLVIYRWNRRYPADNKLPFALRLACPRSVSRRDFAGSSHERITEEVYSR